MEKALFDMVNFGSPSQKIGFSFKNTCGRTRLKENLVLLEPY